MCSKSRSSKLIFPVRCAAEDTETTLELKVSVAEARSASFARLKRRKWADQSLVLRNRKVSLLLGFHTQVICAELSLESILRFPFRAGHYS